MASYRKLVTTIALSVRTNVTNHLGTPANTTTLHLLDLCDDLLNDSDPQSTLTSQVLSTFTTTFCIRV